MNYYVPIFAKIVDSSLWAEPDFVVKVFITMLAKKERDNVCRGNAFNIARWANKTEAEVLEALQLLASPDTKRQEPQAFDGRRIEKVADGWLILNGEFYQRLMKQANRREAKTEWQREKRQEEGKAEDEGDKKPKRVAFVKPTMEEVRLAAAKIGLSELETSKFFSYYEANGWRVGKNPMKNWSHALSGWKMRSNEYGGSQNGGGSGKPNPRNFGVHANTDYSKPAIPRLQRELEEKARLAAESSANGGGSPGADQGDGSSV